MTPLPKPDPEAAGISHHSAAAAAAATMSTPLKASLLGPSAFSTPVKPPSAAAAPSPAFKALQQVRAIASPSHAQSVVAERPPRPKKSGLGEGPSVPSTPSTPAEVSGSSGGKTGGWNEQLASARIVGSGRAPIQEELSEDEGVDRGAEGEGPSLIRQLEL